MAHPVHGSYSKVEAGWPFISVEGGAGANLPGFFADGELSRNGAVDARSEGVGDGAKGASV